MLLLQDFLCLGLCKTILGLIFNLFLNNKLFTILTRDFDKMGYCTKQNKPLLFQFILMLIVSLKKFSPLPGFEPGTSLVQSRYATNWAILAWMHYHLSWLTVFDFRSFRSFLSNFWWLAEFVVNSTNLSSMIRNYNMFCIWF